MRQFIRNIRLLLKLNLAEMVRDQDTLVESFNSLVEATVLIDKKLDGYNSGVYNRRRLPTSQRPPVAVLAQEAAAGVEAWLEKGDPLSPRAREVQQIQAAEPVLKRKPRKPRKARKGR